MKITKERGILCTLMAAGLVALLVDRLSVSPTQEAGGTTAASTAAEAYAVPPVQPTATLPATATLGQQLRSSANVSNKPLRSLFVVSRSWAGAAATPVVAPTESPEARFLKTHRLDGILLSDLGVNAIINGQSVGPGQSVDGFRLVSVDRNIAVLERGEARVNLKLDLDTPAAPGAMPVQ